LLKVLESGLRACAVPKGLDQICNMVILMPLDVAEVPSNFGLILRPSVMSSFLLI